ncbi:MAG: HupE/UreJ family protein [Gammaproteobacteria bacterium]|nr:HupE/UreJ family protein [Gammaproteobacteria bacterium]
MTLRWAARIWLALACLGAGVAEAHVRSESHSVWEIRGTDLDLVMTIPAVEAQRVTGSGPPPSDTLLEAYLSARIYPSSKSGRCALLPPVTALSSQAGFRKFDFTFKCGTAENLEIHSAAFFDLAHDHTNFAQIQNADTGEFTEQLITYERQTVPITGGDAAALRAAGFLDFVRMGIMHIFTGVDHMSFLVGLVLISRRIKDLIFVVTGFTLGHSLTLALAVTGVIRPHAEYIDAMVALTIALIGLENMAVQTRRPAYFAAGLGGLLMVMTVGKLLGYGELPALLTFGAGLFLANYLLISGHVENAGRFRLVITLIFGLIHGFGFAASLLAEPLPVERLAELLVGFNLGVEAGQLTLVVGLSVLVFVLGKAKLALPRPLVVDVAASFLVGIGMFWFLTRSYA